LHGLKYIFYIYTKLVKKVNNNSMLFLYNNIGIGAYKEIGGKVINKGKKK
jgi:hypothetical protein